MNIGLPWQTMEDLANDILFIKNTEDLESLKKDCSLNSSLNYSLENFNESNLSESFKKINLSDFILIGKAGNHSLRFQKG